MRCTMKSHRLRKAGPTSGESGQAMLFLLLVLGLVLLGAAAFSVDMGNIWFHKQSAQNAADAACVAGAMDMLVDATNGVASQGGFTPSTSNTYDCSTNSTISPCRYAGLNKYGGAATGGVVVSFPSTVSGVTSGEVPPAPACASPPCTSTPYIRVDVLDKVPTYFSGLLSGRSTQPVRAYAVCGTVLATAPIPILVLDPRSSDGTTLLIHGNPVITIAGGPQKSIQINGASSDAVKADGTKSKIDLSQGGPKGTGSDLGTWGGPTTALSPQFVPGSTGHWIAPATPIGDPFGQVCYPGQIANCGPINGISAPAKPGAPVVPADEKATRFPASPCLSIPCSVGYKDHGCPELAATRTGTGANKCKLYTPGLYDSTTGFPSGISVGPGGSSTGITALFDPGLYYVVGGLALNSNSTVRPGTGTGDGSGGVVFYFKGSGTVTVAADSGSKVKDPFNTEKGPHDMAGNVYPDDATHTNKTFVNLGVRCAAGSKVPDNLTGGAGSPGVEIGIDPSTGAQTGANLLLGACSGYYGDPLGGTEAGGAQRSFLFFQDRSATGVNPNWGGNGQFLLAGTMYFHSCNSSATGVDCKTTTPYYTDFLTLGGTSGSGTYVLGDVVTDKLELGGTSALTMDLNSNVAFSILKATLLR